MHRCLKRSKKSSHNKGLLLTALIFSLTIGVEKALLMEAWRVSNSCTRDLVGLGWNSQGTDAGGAESGARFGLEWACPEAGAAVVSCELSISCSQKLEGLSYKMKRCKSIILL